MSRCFKDYDVKHIRHSGCVPATREQVDRTNFLALLRCSLRSASHKATEIKDN